MIDDELPELTDAERNAMNTMDLSSILGTPEERIHYALKKALQFFKERNAARNRIEELKGHLAWIGWSEDGVIRAKAEIERLHGAGEPRTTGDRPMMTHDEMIAVIAAHRDGKALQTKSNERDSKWEDCPCPLWNFAYVDYRVKPEPQSIFIPLAHSGDRIKRYYETLTKLREEWPNNEYKTFVEASL
jgi:hypothetical protein